MISECPELADSAVCMYEHTELRQSTTVDRLLVGCRLPRIANHSAIL
jgi:hypothetical protein